MACAVLFASYDLLHSGATPDQLFTLVGLAGLGGFAGAGAVAWAVGRTLSTVWRRLVVSMMAVMGTALTLFVTTLADLAFGRWGVATLGLVCLGAIGVAYRLFLKDGP